MIINFSIENFGSIKNEQTLSFEAENSPRLAEHYITQKGNLRLLKLGMIYGANATGKTTILKALGFLRELVTEPKERKTDELEFTPFLFSPDTLQKPTVFRLAFVWNDIKYEYEVQFDKEAVLQEKLDFYHPHKASVYRRETDRVNRLTRINFGSKIRQDAASKKILEGNTLWNNTVPGGFLKTNIDFKELAEVTDFFNNFLLSPVFAHTDLTGFVTSRIHKGEIPKKHVVDILQKADFHISDIVVKEKEADFPEELKNVLEHHFGASHKLKEKSKISSLDLEFIHQVRGENYALPFAAESQGTHRYYGFAGLLAFLLHGGRFLPIDELENSLHPDLFLHFILAFLTNSENSQLLATTHNREILNEKDIFRYDAIRFTDKKKDCKTELYSLADFDSSVIRNTTNILNTYKSGKLGGVPKTGDLYLNFQ